MKGIEETVREYIEYEELKGHTVQGLKGLKSRIPCFTSFLEGEGISLFGIGINEALEYQGALLKKGLKANTVAAYVTTASSFCQWLKKKGIIPANPFKEIRKVRQERKLPRNILKENQTDKLLSRLSRFDEAAGLKNRKTAYRVHVVAELLYATGMRVSEAAGLRMEDLDLKRGMVYVNEGKGGTNRVAFLDEYAREVLKLYVEKMRPLLFSEWNERNGDLLFGVKWAWFGKIINQVLSKTARRLKLGSFTCHGFRHALGYQLLRAGCNIRHIQQILGHKLLRNTEIYTKVDKEDLRSVLDACHPRKWGKA